jgi:hypothetical protein
MAGPGFPLGEAGVPAHAVRHVERSVICGALAAELAHASHVTLHIRTTLHRPSPAATAREESRQQQARYQHRSSDHGDGDNPGALVGVVSPTAHVLSYQHERVE